MDDGCTTDSAEEAHAEADDATRDPVPSGAAHWTVPCVKDKTCPGDSEVLDAVVPVLFTVATVSLTVVTLGVLYLNISSWWESRSTPNRPKKEYDEKMEEFVSASDRSAAKKKDKKPIKKSTDKGFGP